MKLFNMLSPLSSEDEINRLILKRLSIMEAIAAFKWGRLAIEDSPREQKTLNQIKLECIKHHVPCLQIKPILSIIQLNMTLAKMIQSCCFKDWIDRDITEIQTKSILFTQSMLSHQITKDNALRYLRSYLKEITHELLFHLINPSKNISLNKTTQCLMHCFPELDKNELEYLMTNMMLHIKQLQ